MSNDLKNKDTDDLVEEALNDLLGISGFKKEKVDLSKYIKKDKEAKSNINANIELDNSYKKNTLLFEIIKNAKEQKKAETTQIWKDPLQKIEDEITLEVKLKNKSEYDSDVLRKKILARQAAKRTGGQGLKSIVNSYKKNK